jgi:LysM repeat protein
MRTSKNRSLVIILIILIAIVVVGCTRSASTAPPSDSGNLTIDEINQRATMDAVRDAILTQTHEPSIEIPTATATILVPTSTPVVSDPTATPPVVIDTPIPASGEPQLYLVQSGEHLYSIARKFGVDPTDLIALNLEKGYLTSAEDILYPGDEILIPSTNGSQSFSGTCQSHYTVLAGDWINSVAREFADNPQDTASVEAKADEIIQANDLIFPYTIYADVILCIP